MEFKCNLPVASGRVEEKNVDARDMISRKKNQYILKDYTTMASRQTSGFQVE